MNAVGTRIFRIALRLVTLVVGISAVCLVLGGAGIYLWSSSAKETAPVTISLTADKLEKVFWDIYLLPKRDLVTTPAAPHDDTSTTFVIEQGETLWSVSLRLESGGLITDSTVFRRVVQSEGLDRQIEAGAYTLRPSMTMHEIMQELQVGRVPDVLITFPEGWRIEQVARKLYQEGVIRSEQAFLDEARRTRSGYTALHGLPTSPAGGMEGYLYPETYRFDAGSLPADIVDRMVAVLASEITAAMVDLALRQGLSMYEVMTLASIVEREAIVEHERELIAGVYLNRLKQGMPLQADPTVQYGKGCEEGADGELICWKPLIQEEYNSVISDYNTYLHGGLPPGPICNPRIASIWAVLEPADTDYLFFRSKNDGSGEHVFARTYEEHLRYGEIYGGIGPSGD